jgi:hypothetical protein
MIDYLLLSVLLLGAGIALLLWRWRHARRRSQDYYVCLDGHLVRSRGEWMIDAALQYLSIPHTYEQRLPLGERTIHPDFSLGHGIFLEYWGLQTRTYLQHKAQKQKGYKARNYHLINVENSDLKNLVSVLITQLKPFQTFFPQLHNMLELNQK